MLGTENTFPITSHQSLNLLIFSKRSCHPLRQGDRRRAREEQVKIELVWAKIRTEYLFGQSQDAEVITYGQLITHDTIWYHHCLLASNTNSHLSCPHQNTDIAVATENSYWNHPPVVQDSLGLIKWRKQNICYPDLLRACLFYAFLPKNTKGSSTF